MITKTKVLIIKLGHSETLASDISKECSLGDIVRTTVILNYFKAGDSITWLCDEAALPLLKGNPYVDRILTWNMEVAIQLQREKFDVVVNLEKHPGICALSDSINAWQKYGFRFSDWTGQAEAHYNTEKVLAIATNTLTKEKNKKYWQEHLAKVIGKHWSINDKYILTENKKGRLNGIGLNWRVGKKWPDKEWPHENWNRLGKLLVEGNFNVSFQPDFALADYMDWIAGCNFLVTCDSLGMHLAIAYGIPIVVLFGPTRSNEVYFYGKGKTLQAQDGKMESIKIEDVFNAVKETYLENKMDRKEPSSV